MSKFYLPSSTPASTTSPSPLISPTSTAPTATLPLRGLPEETYGDTDSDPDDLPYPEPLSRTAFLDPDFSAEHYLSTLRNRHQTLEDLRTELRDRVRDLSRQLVDLVNDEYEDLMGVGMGLRGGEERVEGVRIGVLGFRREVEGVRGLVGQRMAEVGALVGERREIREGIVLGRRLVDVEGRMVELETRLGVDGAPDEDDAQADEDEDEDDDDGTAGPRRSASLYGQLKKSMDRIGEHPFLEAQKGRLDKIRDALFLDLGAALRSARKDQDGKETVLKLVAAYTDIGEAGEAIKALKTR